MDKGMKKKQDIKPPKRRPNWHISWMTKSGRTLSVEVSTGLAAVEYVAGCVNLDAVSITVLRGKV